MAVELASAQCCIAGGGPAGVMAGLLLARAGVDVLVLEKHADFFRDFRGDTLHPSTLELMHELGLDRELLRLPHQKVRELAFHVGARAFKVADFSHLPVRHPFIALMPQWDFLNFLAETGARYPLHWTIRVPSLGFDLEARTPLNDQELASPRANWPAYWEGAITIEGVRHAQRVTGVGYLEMTGYDRPVVLPQ